MQIPPWPTEQKSDQRFRPQSPLALAENLFNINEECNELNKKCSDCEKCARTECETMKNNLETLVGFLSDAERSDVEKHAAKLDFAKKLLDDKDDDQCAALDKLQAPILSKAYSKQTEDEKRKAKLDFTIERLNGTTVGDILQNIVDEKHFFVDIFFSSMK